jgi:hypothetical protein
MVCPHRAQRPVESLRLASHSVSLGINSKLCDHKGAISGDVMEPRKVGIEIFLILQINIERAKISVCWL